MCCKALSRYTVVCRAANKYELYMNKENVDPQLDNAQTETKHFCCGCSLGVGHLPFQICPLPSRK